MSEAKDGATGPASSGTSATRTIPPEIYARLLEAEALVQSVAPMCDAVTVASPTSQVAPLSEPVTQRKPGAPKPPSARATTPRGTMIMSVEAILASRAAAEKATVTMTMATPFRMGMASTEPNARAQTLLGVAAVGGDDSSDGGLAPDSMQVRALLDEISMIIEPGALQHRIEDASTMELEAIVERLRQAQGLDAATLESAPPPPAPVQLLPPPPARQILTIPIPPGRGSDPELAWSQMASSAPPPMPSTRREGRRAAPAPRASRAARWVVAVAGGLAAVVGVVVAVRMFDDVRLARAFEPATSQAGGATSDVPATTGERQAPAFDAPAASDEIAAPLPSDPPAAAAEETVIDDPELVPPPRAMTARERLRLEEAYVVARAEKALAKGDSAAALAVLARAEKRFPESTAALADAREALAIEALATAGRSDEALGRATRFGEKYPKSRYKDRVGKINPPPAEAPGPIDGPLD